MPDCLVRKKAGFTHDMANFGYDVRGKRFNTHGVMKSTYIRHLTRNTIFIRKNSLTDKTAGPATYHDQINNHPGDAKSGNYESSPIGSP